MIQPLIKKVSKKEEEWNEIGLSHAERGDLRTAALSFKAGLEANPKNPILWNNLGIAQKMIGDLKAATISLEKAKSHGLSDPEILLNLGNTCLLQKDLKRAREAFERALTIDPEFVEANNNLAVVIFLESPFSAFETAKSLLLRAIKTRSGFAEAYLNLGDIQRLTQPLELSEALANYDLAIKIKKLPEAYNSRGLLWNWTGTADFRMAIKLNPSFLPARVNFAKALIWQSVFNGKAKPENELITEALAELEFVLQKEPYNFEALVLHSRILRGTNRLAEALKEISLALELEPNDKDARLTRSEIFCDLNCFKEAEKDLQKVLRKGKEF